MKVMNQPSRVDGQILVLHHQSWDRCIGNERFATLRQPTGTIVSIFTFRQNLTKKIWKHQTKLQPHKLRHQQRLPRIDFIVIVIDSQMTFEMTT